MSPLARCALAIHLCLWPLVSATAQDSPLFVDVTASSGVDFVHNTGAFGEKWLPETMGSGVLVFDANGDDQLDLLFLNGTRFPGQQGRATTQALFLNRGGLKFRDATEEGGLGIDAYCLGGAAGDLDNDGDADLYLSCLGNDYLLENQEGRFLDVSSAAGLTREYEFGSSVALVDYNRDGLLDIFAGRYVTWTPETDLFCDKYATKTKSYCTPEPYQGASPRLYRNAGSLRFEDVSAAAEIRQPDAKSLGVSVLDVDDDGWPDIAVANDTQPNLLYRNLGNGRFEEIGLLSGMAFDETGVARGGMGIDSADLDGTGRSSLVIGNFANEMAALYRNEGNLLFVDVAAPAQIGRPTLLVLTFGAFFFDFDLDGDQDLLFANGHLEPEAENTQNRVTYAQPTQLFRNDGARFSDVTGTVAGDLATPRVARGAAWGDLDGDGDADVVLTTNGGPPAIFESRVAPTRWLGVDLQGTTSNRDAIGATVELRSPSGVQRQTVRAGSSYLSQSQRSLLFGLPADHGASELTLLVRWPDGTEQQWKPEGLDRTIRIVEPGPNP